MKLILENFRCHRKAIFDIPDSGLVLLSGISGSGKTTILNGIYYALYGKVRKPYSHDTNTCTVIFEYNSIKITRTNRPNKLIVVYKKKEYNIYK